MATLTSKELLDKLLAGDYFAPDELEQFIRERRDEDQYFDYKDGAITKRENLKDGRQTIRKMICGFANSDGGVLIVGVSEPEEENAPRTIAPSEPRIGKQTLVEWATRCLQSMAGFFSPQPRFQVIQHEEGLVLTIAIARAPSLVPCVEAGELKYFFRIGESTVEAPAYLIADLVLGRRQHPTIDLPLATIEDDNLDLKISERDSEPVRKISFSFEVENLSLATADGVTIGVISRSFLERGKEEELNNHLRLYLDIPDLSIGGIPSSLAQVVHCSSLTSGSLLTLAPFQNRQVRNIGSFYFPRTIPLKIFCAVYILSKGAPPTWFQLEFRSVPGGNLQALVRKSSERPKITWEEVT